MHLDNEALKWVKNIFFRNLAMIFDPYLIKNGKDVTSDSVIPPASRVVLEGCLKILHILLRVFDSFFSNWFWNYEEKY